MSTGIKPGNWLLDKSRLKLLSFKKHRGPFYICLAYFIFGFLWILLSDIILLVCTENNIQFVRYQTYKGWVFIVITSILVYILSHVYAVHKEKSLTLLKENDKIIRESLKEKETLLMEIHHRVKNNFQIIISLLRMKSKIVQDDILTRNVNEIINKINAISLVHEKLYETESLSDVDFKSYIHDIVKHLLISHSLTGSIKTEFDLDDIVLPIEKAVPCGILINEVITRIFNYAFPEDKTGLIAISMKKENTNRISLVIEDNGMFMAEEDNNPDRRFEMKMIHILSDQIKGDIQIHSTDIGTRYALVFMI